MTLEQLALLGIAVFAFMAVTTFFNTVRTIKRMTQGTTRQRARRLIGAPTPAKAVAVAVVEEISGRHPEEVELSRERGQLTETLEKALNEGRAYFLSRVESRHRIMFSEAIDEIVFNKKGENK